jgi:hypothetical protein
LGNDTIRDNVVGNPLACARVFTSADIDALGASRGLTAGQIQAIKDVYAGPHTSAGHRWYKGKSLGTEFSWGAFVVPTPANHFLPRSRRILDGVRELPLPASFRANGAHRPR